MSNDLETQATLGRLTFLGISWTAASTAIQTVVNIATFATLARLLPPEDFGIVGAALVVGTFAQAVAQLGIPVAVVQRLRLSREDSAVAAHVVLVLATTIS